MFNKSKIDHTKGILMIIVTIVLGILLAYFLLYAIMAISLENYSGDWDPPVSIDYAIIED